MKKKYLRASQNYSKQECRKLYGHFEIIFADRKFMKSKNLERFHKKVIAKARASEERILDFMFFDPGMGVKATYNGTSQWRPGETDVTGVNNMLRSFAGVPWEDS